MVRMLLSRVIGLSCELVALKLEMAISRLLA